MLMVAEGMQRMHFIEYFLHLFLQISRLFLEILYFTVQECILMHFEIHNSPSFGHKVIKVHVIEFSISFIHYSQIYYKILVCFRSNIFIMPHRYHFFYGFFDFSYLVYR